MSYCAIHDGNTIRVSCNYNPKWITEIKMCIPPGHRRWDKDDKVWIVSIQYDEMLKQLASVYHGVPPEEEETPTDSWSDYLTSLPAREVYLALVAIYHPDHGGDEQAMQDLTAAWQLYDQAEL